MTVTIQIQYIYIIFIYSFIHSFTVFSQIYLLRYGNRPTLLL